MTKVFVLLFTVADDEIDYAFIIDNDTYNGTIVEEVNHDNALVVAKETVNKLLNDTVHEDLYYFLGHLENSVDVIDSTHDIVKPDMFAYAVDVTNKDVVEILGAAAKKVEIAKMAASNDVYQSSLASRALKLVDI